MLLPVVRPSIAAGTCMPLAGSPSLTTVCRKVAILPATSNGVAVLFALTRRALMSRTAFTMSRVEVGGAEPARLNGVIVAAPGAWQMMLVLLFLFLVFFCCL